MKENRKIILYFWNNYPHSVTKQNGRLEDK